MLEQLGINGEGLRIREDRYDTTTTTTTKCVYVCACLHPFRLLYTTSWVELTAYRLQYKLVHLWGMKE